MAVVFIQGASRGIGLEFARALGARGGVRVLAGCRDPDGAHQLQQVARIYQEVIFCLLSLFFLSVGQCDNGEV